MNAKLIPFNPSLLVPLPGERGVFVALTGSGKSTLEKRVVGPYFGKRQIVIDDPKLDPIWLGMDATYIRKLKDIPKYPFPRYPLLVFRPEGPEDNYDVHDALFEWVYQRGNTVLVCDEVTQIVKGPTSYGQGFNNLLTRGRVRNCTTLLGTQRPAWAPRIIFSESQKFYIGDLSDKRDRETIAAITTKELINPVQYPHDFQIYLKPRRGLMLLECIPCHEGKPLPHKPVWDF